MEFYDLPRLLNWFLFIGIQLLFVSGSIVALQRRRDFIAIMVLLGSLFVLASIVTNMVIYWDIEDRDSNGPHPVKQQILVASGMAALFGGLLFAIGLIMMMSTQRRKEDEDGPQRPPAPLSR